jgi:uncharacterized protein (TIGR02466 family)
VTRFDIFTTPMWMVPFMGAEKFKKDVVPFFLDYEKKFPMNIEYSMNGYTSYSREVTNILEFDELLPLKKFILEIAEIASNEVGIKGKHYLTDSWFNINRKYSYHGMHNHIPDVWSGIYYVQAEEEDANICFYDLNKNSNWPWQSVASKWTGQMRKFPPQTGRLYLFPSYIMHEVEQHSNDNERISISFNIGLQ